MMYPNATIEQLHEFLREAEKELKEFTDYKKNKPAGVWMHRSTGTEARETIRTIKAELKRRQNG